MTTINWSGYTWNVKAGQGLGPGPNDWDPNNVSIDADGYLHLKISNTAGNWSCAEIYLSSTQTLGFGTYQWQILGRPDILDNNVVLGLFNYTLPGIGPDGTNEIDVEFATWGGVQPNHGNWVVWPANDSIAQTAYQFDATPNTAQSTHRFNWQSEQVAYQALAGLHDPTDNAGEYANWTFAPSNSIVAVPQQPLPVHLNLWLFQGQAPTDGQEVEMVISSFSYTP